MKSDRKLITEFLAKRRSVTVITEKHHKFKATMGNRHFTSVASFWVLLAGLTLPSPALTFFLDWGPDLEGPWCATRPAGADCCEGRDDDCSVPILNTECYCDVFCNHTAHDCCPDFWSHCFGATKIPPPTTPRTTPAEIRRECELGGRLYRPDDTVIDNCRECTCQLLVAGTPRRYQMRCTDDVCLIRPDLIEAVNSGPYSSWRAGNYSFLWGKTLADGVRYRLGTYPLEQEVVLMTPIKVRQDEALPESFDARLKWPGKLQPIKDQGDCASSWAVSTAAVASDRLAIESDGAMTEELSAQHMLSCDTDGQDGCTGGKVDRAWFFLRKFGVVTDACYPYNSGTTRVKDACQLPVRQRGGQCPSGVQYKIDKRYKASPPYRIRPMEREIMKEIMDNGPVQAIFEVREDFYMYKSGVYQYSNLTRNDPPAARKSAYHSVRLLGWGVDRTPGDEIIKYWIGANSWGRAWGESGYFRIIRGVNANNIENYIVGAWGKVTGDVSLRKLLADNRRRRLLAGGDPVAEVTIGLSEDDDNGLRRLRNLIGRGRGRGGQQKVRNVAAKRLRSLQTGKTAARRQEGVERDTGKKKKATNLSPSGTRDRKPEKMTKKGQKERRKGKKPRGITVMSYRTQ